MRTMYMKQVLRPLKLVGRVEHCSCSSYLVVISDHSTDKRQLKSGGRFRITWSNAFPAGIYAIYIIGIISKGFPYQDLQFF